AFRAASGLQTYFWASGRQGAGVIEIQFWQRNSSGTPSGSFTQVGETSGFLLIGQLKNTLAEGTAIPTTGILIVATPDAQAAIEAAFEDQADTTIVGKNLLNLLLIDNEFVLCTGASISGADVQITAAYRGELDSVQAAHSAGANVYLLQGNVSSAPLPE